jgi:hypothetical protein
MSRDHGGQQGRVSTARRRDAQGGGALPEPPESSFWLERTPLPTARRPGDAGARARSPLMPPGTMCPKCDSPLSPSEPACPSCGLKRLMFARFRASAADRVPPGLERMWRRVESSWSDPELHEQFLAQVSLCGAYAYAASCYRRAARQRQSDAIAKLQLERLSRMVHAVMAVSAVRAESKTARPYRGLIALLVMLVALGAVASLYMLKKRGASAEQSVERVAPSITVRRGRSLGADGKPTRAFGGLRAAGNKGRAGAQDPEAQDPDAQEPEQAEGEGELDPEAQDPEAQADGESEAEAE